MTLAVPELVKPTGSFPYRKPGAPLRPTLGPQVCAWLERFAKMSGELHGEPVRLTVWQRAFIYTLYELEVYHDQRRGCVWARRAYTRAVLGIPKGNGKSPLASWIALVELLGPSRFVGWDDDGNPVGGLRNSPEVYVAATNFKQSRLVFADIAGSCNASPELTALAEVLSDRITLRGAPGEISRLASNASGVDGLRPSCFIADELHLWENNAEVFLSLLRGAKKRPDSLVLAITTAGPGDDLDKSLLGGLVSRGKKANDPNDPFTDDRLLLWWYEAPGDVELSWDMDADVLRRLVRQANPAADDFVDVEELVAGFYAHEQPLYDFARYHLNRWVTAAGQWLPPGAFEKLVLPPEEGGPVWEDGRIVSGGLRPGERIVAAFDGSWSHDTTALVACSLDREVPYLQVLALWERPEGGSSDWRVPTVEVRSELKRTAALYSCREIACDSARWQHVISELSDEGLPMGEFQQGAAHMGPAGELFYRAVCDGALRWDGHPRFSEHLRNAVPRTTIAGTVLMKQSRSSPLRIDVAIAGLMAYARACAPEDKSPAVGIWDLDAIEITEDDWNDLGL